MPRAQQEKPHVVWGCKRAVADTCPKSMITAQSITWIEEFLICKRLFHGFPFDLSARQAEAFLILEEELLSEEHGGKQNG